MMLGLAPIAPTLAKIAPAEPVRDWLWHLANVEIKSARTGVAGMLAMNANAVISGKCLAMPVTAEQICAGLVCSPKLAADAVTAGPEWYKMLAENPVRSDQIHKNAIVTRKIVLPRQQA